MLYKNQQLENVSRLNPRLQGILGGVVSLGLLCVMSWLAFFGFDSAGLLKSDVIATPAVVAPASSTAAVTPTTVPAVTTSAQAPATPVVATTTTLAPVAIKSFTPMSGPVGTFVFITTDRTPTDLKIYFTGINGTKIQADGLETVYVGGVATLKTKVPAGSVTGHIVITSNAITSESQSNFTVAGAGTTISSLSSTPTANTSATGNNPTTITGFTPAEGEVGTPVYVALSELGSSASAYKVFFAGSGGTRIEAVNPEVVLMGANRVLKVKVPVGSVTGKVALTANGVTAESQWDFKIAGSLADSLASSVPVVITHITPESANVGVYIEITGEGFAPRADDNMVEFIAPNDTTVRSRNVKVVSIGGKQVLRVRVPEGALTGRITVTVAGRTAMSESDLVIGGVTANASGKANGIFTVTELSTYEVKPGDQLLVAGQGIARPEAIVKIGGRPITVVNRSKGAAGDLLLTVVTPTAKSGFLTVELGDQIAIHPKQVTVSGSTGGAPLIDVSRNRLLPKNIEPTTSSLSIYTFVSDADGAEDVVSVIADLSTLGGRPSEELKAGPIEGLGRVYSLEKTTILEILENGKEYTVPLIATDKTGLTDRSQITFCVGQCLSPADLAGTSDVTSDATSSTDSATADTEPVIIRPDAPTSVAVAADRGFLRLSWDAPKADSGITGYYVYYGASRGAYLHRVPAGFTNIYFLSGLTPRQMYHLAVVAIDATGTESLPSDDLVAEFPYKIENADAASTDTQPTLETAMLSDAHGAAPTESAVPEFSYADSEQGIGVEPDSAITAAVTSVESPHAAARTALTATGPAENALIALLIAVILSGAVAIKIRPYITHQKL